MKRMLFLLSAVVLCLCLLTACSCAHDWKEANCTTPKTCTKCQEVEGEALGHNWQEATCTEPRTCTICALAEEETAPHVYGKWSTSNLQTMDRGCEVCGFVESSTINHSAMLEELLFGTSWKVNMVSNGSNIASIEESELNGSIHFDDQFGVTLNMLDGKTYSGKWCLDSTQTYPGNGTIQYKFSSVTTSEQSVEFAYFENVYDSEDAPCITQDIGSGMVAFYFLEVGE